MGGVGNTVLLEGSVNSVARESSLGAEGFVGLLAKIAGEAGAIEPLREASVPLRT